MDAEERGYVAAVVEGITDIREGLIHLTCSEADKIAWGLARLGYRDEAVLVLTGHCSDDEYDREQAYSRTADTSEWDRHGWERPGVDAEAEARWYLGQLLEDNDGVPAWNYRPGQ